MSKYEIIIKDETVSKKKSPIADNGNDSNTVDTEKEALKARQETVGAYFAVKRVVSPFISQAINYGVSTIAVRTGANEQQQRVQFAVDMGSKALGFAESIAIGAAVGGVWGAIGGALMSVATTVTGIALNQAKIDLNRSVEGNSLVLMNIRAGGSPASNGSR